MNSPHELLIPAAPQSHSTIGFRPTEARMQMSPRWNGTVDVVRGQFRMLTEIADSIRLSTDDTRRALSLSEAEWSGWAEFMRNGPMPAWPRLPDILHRIGTASFNMATVTEESLYSPVRTW